MEVEYFVDCHCHMFTVTDLPLYRSTYAMAQRATIAKKLMVPFFSLIVPAMDVPKKVAALRKFMTFFEKEPLEACTQVLEELSEIAKAGADGGVFKAGKVVVTPLVMDFYDPDDSHDKLISQAGRLRSAIINIQWTGVLVLPFLGLDPRRGTASIEYLLDNLTLGSWDGKVKSIPDRENETSSGGVATGDFIGIKLYPPLGFDPLPEEDELRDDILAVYQLFSNRRLPLTVHCQNSGLELVKDGGKLSHPKKWQKVLEKVPNLRINFAHFGGEEGVKAMIPFVDRPQEGPGVEGRPKQYRGIPVLDGWTGRIVQLLRKYENTYADLSAFDFSDREAVAALHWVLYHDLNGDFDDLGRHSILTKLLWGSDYPMPLKRKDGNDTKYANLYQECADALTFTDQTQYWDFPDFSDLSDVGELRAKVLRGLVCDTPKTFLGLANRST